jgi:hypothetical protein
VDVRGELVVVDNFREEAELLIEGGKLEVRFGSCGSTEMIRFRTATAFGETPSVNHSPLDGNRGLPDPSGRAKL